MVAYWELWSWCYEYKELRWSLRTALFCSVLSDPHLYTIGSDILIPVFYILNIGASLLAIMLLWNIHIKTSLLLRSHENSQSQASTHLFSPYLNQTNYRQ
ncbi:hypothetical protein BDV29DRAFT_26959 [Aspergillus leporis]|uniref:Uncharacterized protein n=1 Tax=Aspergillus leporis TaxID=41062 RepID=A0A5N5XDD5_9EURO|nr:hypothetical protein BDV29DRAFT_26959 [Aspergillus leporis]